MSEALTIVRVCAACQPVGTAPMGAIVSHGVCRRHFVAALREAGCRKELIAEMLAEMEPEAFCADLTKTEASTINSGPSYDRPDAPH